MYDDAESDLGSEAPSIFAPTWPCPKPRTPVSVVSPTFRVWTRCASGRERHVRQAESVQMDEDGRPYPFACGVGECGERGCDSAGSPSSRNASAYGCSCVGDHGLAREVTTSSVPSSSSLTTPEGYDGEDSGGRGAPGGVSSSSEASRLSSSGGAGGVAGGGGGYGSGVYADDTTSVDDDVMDDDVMDDDDDDGGSTADDGSGQGGVDAGTEVVLCRAPTLGCLKRSCGRAGTQVAVLWEGFGCFAAGANLTFACRVGGEVVPAEAHGFGSGDDADGRKGGGDAGDWGWGSGGKGGGGEWGPSWDPGNGDGDGRKGAAGGALVFEVPRLEWVEEGEADAVLVPVEVMWSLPDEVRECP